MPAVSVIMPVYNAERYLKQSIGSVLEQSFRQLDLDRQKLETEKKQFNRYREDARNSLPKTRPLEYRQGIFFKGITNQLALKKRYKDLIKIFHPDNVDGDNWVILEINKEYDYLSQYLV